MLQGTESQRHVCTCNFGTQTWSTQSQVSAKHPLRRYSLQGWLLSRQRPRRGTFRCRNGGVDIAKEIFIAVSQPPPGLAAGLFVNSTVFLLGIKILLRGLTPAGVAHSWVLGTLVYSAFGAGGYLLVCLYFIFGSAVTKIKLEQKQKEGIAEARSGRRSPGSVYGSGAAGMACAAAALLTGNIAFWQVGFVASFVSKLSDTVSSEIGKAYGKTTYLITTLERVPRGTEGAVSAEGTAAGAAAALLFAALAAGVGQVDVKEAAIVALAATAANIFESWLGASVQGRLDWLTNDVVNMIQISVAAALAISARTALSVV